MNIPITRSIFWRLYYLSTSYKSVNSKCLSIPDWVLLKIQPCAKPDPRSGYAGMILIGEPVYQVETKDIENIIDAHPRLDVGLIAQRISGQHPLIV